MRNSSTSIDRLRSRTRAIEEKRTAGSNPLGPHPPIPNYAPTPHRLPNNHHPNRGSTAPHVPPDRRQPPLFTPHNQASDDGSTTLHVPPAFCISAAHLRPTQLANPRLTFASNHFAYPLPVPSLPLCKSIAHANLGTEPLPPYQIRRSCNGMVLCAARARMEKDFDRWNEIKKATDAADEDARLYFREGEIWWVRLGHNIGYEANGKSREFTRPVIILKKYNQYSFLALPLTTVPKPNPYRLPVGMVDGRQAFATLSQLRNIDIHRSRHDPKILWVDDAEIVGDQITKVRPIPRNLFTQKTERRIGELGASCVALVVSDVSVHEAP